MYICIFGDEEKPVLHRNCKASPEAFLKAIAPYREDIVVAVECMFVWYWLADVCTKEKIPFVLGHDLYIKAIHGGKSKAISILAHKIGRAVYFMLKRKEPFNMETFFAHA